MNTMTQPVTLTENARTVLASRYLMRDSAGQVSETPEEMFRRVARVIAGAESRYGVHESAVGELANEFENLMSYGVFLPNSPTLMNAGRRMGMLSACFVLPVEDTIEGIFESVKLTALIQKAGGGTGFAFDRLRPTGDLVSSSGGQTSGPISFWRVFSEATSAIQQGAFRRGANMGMMSIAHPDILKFILAKRDLASFTNFNISVKVSNSFMEELRTEPRAAHAVINPRNGAAYFIPHGVPVDTYTIHALQPINQGGQDCYTRQEIWRLIVEQAHASGEPGVCFIDRINADNATPRLGRIEATNPCGEQPLLDYEACNLGSINLGRFVEGGRLDLQAFGRAVRTCVRFLDDVIDENNYPAPQVAALCLGNRKIGLGVMGLADALIAMGIAYDSDRALQVGEQIARALRENAEQAGAELAKQRGSFPNWLGSRWDFERHMPMRNAALTTVAPTGTISIIADCSGGIEPLFSLAYQRHVLDGKRLWEVNAQFRRVAGERGFLSDDLIAHAAGQGTIQGRADVPEDVRRLFVTARDIAPRWHVAMQAAFQKHIDGAISKTINLPASATVEQVAEVFDMAYDSGCKGVTVYRDSSRAGQPMALVPEPEKPARVCPNCQQSGPLPEGCVRCPSCGATLCG